MTSEDVQTVIQDYRLSLDVISALGFIVANKDRAIGLFGADFYVSCESVFRNSHID